MNRILFVSEHSKTFDVQWHSHDYWELIYCTSGEGAFRLENSAVLHYREGELIAIPPRLFHANMSGEGFASIHIQMENPSFPCQTVFQVSDDLERHLESVFQQAKYYFLSDMKKRDLLLSALGELITCYLVVYLDNTGFSEPVEKIRSSILHNYARTDFALDEAIRELPFHYDYARKRFKKEIGQTPLEYMTQLRMKKAENMLSSMASMGHTVAEVAQLCGYDNALYFSRVFKKHFGVSPSAMAGKGKNNSSGENNGSNSG